MCCVRCRRGLAVSNTLASGGARREQNEKRPAEERYPLVKGVRDPDRWLKTVARVDLNATDVARVVAAAAACGGLPRSPAEGWLWRLAMS